MSYQLNTKGEAAAKAWINDKAPGWDEAATLAEIDEVLANRSEGESLEVEMRGPNWKGGNMGLIFFTPAEDEVDFIPDEDD